MVDTFVRIREGGQTLADAITVAGLDTAIQEDNQETR
jgi:hypothetical protein